MTMSSFVDQRTEWLVAGSDLPIIGYIGKRLDGFIEQPGEAFAVEADGLEAELAQALDDCGVFQDDRRR